MEYSDLYVRRIRQLCKERGIAINKLATMSGINQSTIDNIVRGLTKNHDAPQDRHCLQYDRRGVFGFQGTERLFLRRSKRGLN